MHPLNVCPTLQKIVKSLDSSVGALKEKSVNNNKPVKPVLSLDNNTSSQQLGASSTSSAAAAAAPTLKQPSLLASKRDLTPNASASDSSSPASSNGSNQTLTPPMTIDNQNRLAAKGDTLGQAQAQAQAIGQPQSQLVNGSSANSISSSISTAAMIHANNSNLIAAGHLAQVNPTSSQLNAGKCQPAAPKCISITFQLVEWVCEWAQLAQQQHQHQQLDGA